MNEGQQYLSFIPDGLPQVADGQGKTYVERILSEKGGFTFLGDPLTGPPKIQSANDIAFLFKNLENAATENIFAVLHKKDGDYSVLYLSTGTSTSAMVEIPLIVAAMKELNAESITLVHNHPAGVLKASNQDKHLHAVLLDSLPEGSVNDSIIINLSSGKYATFTNTYSVQNDIKPSNSIQEARVYQFDRLKLHTNGEPRITMRSGKDVAEFLSQQKSGAVNKIHCIILDASNQIARYCLYDGNLSANILANKILTDVGKFGNNIILSKNEQIANYKIHVPQEENILYFNKISNLLKLANVKVLDFLEIPHDERILKEYCSFAESGLLSEPKESYGEINLKNNITMEQNAKDHYGYGDVEIDPFTEAMLDDIDSGFFRKNDNKNNEIETAAEHARNPNTSKEELIRLSFDKDPYVRGAVARNLNTLPETLRKLAKDKNAWVRRNVAQNPNTPLEILMELAKDKNAWVRHSVTNNPNTPKEVLRGLAKDKDERVQLVAKNKLAQTSPTFNVGFVPQKIGGVELTQEQKKDLSNGKQITLKNFTTKVGRVLSAVGVRFSENRDKINCVELRQSNNIARQQETTRKRGMRM
jgi:DNA repair protein RadC